MANLLLDKTIEILKRDGLLLEADSKLPSLATLIAGEPIKGSWWGHPKGKVIFNTSSNLHDHPDVLVLKLVCGKITFLHRKYWPQLITIASAMEPWQTEGLSNPARKLLKLLESKGSLRTDQLRGKSTKALGTAAKELEARLLVHAGSIHTETGSHAKQIETWSSWMKQHGLKVPKLEVDEAKRDIEVLVVKIGQQSGAKVSLPWCKRLSSTIAKSCH